ncbi:hypothetical protein FN846DRAFT_901961 [Sphaerosporella brunnea]|uniref:Uncharacterized protein n=1 Tax=Sphaerosporella brunnea TaxID=1250544 RepID=A0A5J5FB09_9PEZI|nr:hypothetical protein FN846DRAFT_901961 [Sphaerosporella brunnea]
MPSTARNTVQLFIDDAMQPMIAAGFVPRHHWEHCDLTCGILKKTCKSTVHGFRGPYRYSHKQPDISTRNQMWNKTGCLPTFVVESGPSRKYHRNDGLLEAKDIWLVDGDGGVRCMLLVIVDKTWKPPTRRDGVHTAFFGPQESTLELPLPSASSDDDDDDDDVSVGFFDDMVVVNNAIGFPTRIMPLERFPSSEP